MVARILCWVLPLSQFSLILKQNKINSKKSTQGLSRLFPGWPELVGAKNMEWAGCGIAVLLQPCQVVSSRSTVCTWSISQVPARHCLVALRDPFLWSWFSSPDVWIHRRSLFLLKHQQSPRAGSWKARTIKPARNDTSESSRRNRLVSFDL